MAQVGCIEIIHRNLSVEEQALAFKAVKQFESGIVQNPITLRPVQKSHQIIVVGGIKSIFYMELAL